MVYTWVCKSIWSDWRSISIAVWFQRCSNSTRSFWERKVFLRSNEKRNVNSYGETIEKEEIISLIQNTVDQLINAIIHYIRVLRNSEYSLYVNNLNFKSPTHIASIFFFRFVSLILMKIGWKGVNIKWTFWWQNNIFSSKWNVSGWRDTIIWLRSCGCHGSLWAGYDNLLRWYTVVVVIYRNLLTVRIE